MLLWFEVKNNMERKIGLVITVLIITLMVVIASIYFMIKEFKNSETSDRDGDGYDDDIDAFPNNPEEWHDNDEDGVGDNSDDFPDDEDYSALLEILSSNMYRYEESVFVVGKFRNNKTYPVSCMIYAADITVTFRKQTTLF
jgi:hypothetical protein